ncbi:hypothetical protein [Curtobacterium flaccumfaciens]|uniref:hypothetical protein n=1 Tax=Curtobacterium flaccumfaciens TaxID=2035 RepID=UPI003995F054
MFTSGSDHQRPTETDARVSSGAADPTTIAFVTGTHFHAAGTTSLHVAVDDLLETRPIDVVQLMRDQDRTSARHPRHPVS